jgi:hypothetical protein
MSIYIDSFYKIGHQHRVNEDYAINDENTAVLCDGCSSAKNTDVGVRLLANAFLIENIGQALDSSYEALSKFGNSYLNECLLCTAGKITSDKRVWLYGDGVISTDDYLYDVDYNNVPFYPWYDYNGLRLNYIRDFGPPTCKISAYSPTIEWTEEHIIEHYLEPSFAQQFSLSRCIILFSDGVKTFTDGQGQPVSVQDIVSDIRDFKSLTGEFLKRRLNKLFKTKWKYYTVSDDFSCIALVEGDSDEIQNNVE